MTLDAPTKPDAERALSPVHRAMLTCGVLYGLTYVVANDLVAGLLYDGYDPIDQAISELSAKGASTRTILVVMLPVWTAMLIAFGLGVRRSARGGRALRITGALLIAQGIFDVLWFWFPMTARDDIVPGTTTGNDTGHLILAGGSVVFFLATIACGAVAFGWGFRVYSLATVVTAVVFGSLTSQQAVHIADREPTPLMGFYERVNIGGWLLWMAVLAVTLLRGAVPDRGRDPTGEG